MIDALRTATKVYFDSAPLIYLIESTSVFAEQVAPVFGAIDAGQKRGLTSYVTLIELLVKPIRIGRSDLATAYRELLLGQGSFDIYEVGAQVAEEAARLRARHEFLKVPDAIQLATARVHRADVFVTNDATFRRFTDPPVVVLSDYSGGPSSY